MSVQAGSVRLSVLASILVTVTPIIVLHKYSPIILTRLHFFSLHIINTIFAGYPFNPETFRISDVKPLSYPSLPFIIFITSLVYFIFEFTGISYFIEANLFKNFGTVFYFSTSNGKHSQLAHIRALADDGSVVILPAKILAGVLPTAVQQVGGDIVSEEDQALVNTLVDAGILIPEAQSASTLAGKLFVNTENNAATSLPSPTLTSRSSSSHSYSKFSKIKLTGKNKAVYYLNVQTEDQKDFDSIFGIIKTPISPTANSITEDDSSEIDVAEELPANIYAHILPKIEAEFLSHCFEEKEPASDNEADGTPWVRVVSLKNEDGWEAEVHRKAGEKMYFRYTTILKTTPETAFDYLSDITNRPEWDPLCEEANVLQRFPDGGKVQYFRTRGMWPTKPRCTLVCSFAKKYDEHKYLFLSQSIENHPDFKPVSGDVRMTAHLAGQLVLPDPQNRPNFCKVVQILHGDLGGWLPQNVVSLVTTQSIPKGLRKVFHILKTAEPYTVSKAISAIENYKPEPRKVTQSKLKKNKLSQNQSSNINSSSELSNSSLESNRSNQIAQRMNGTVLANKFGFAKSVYKIIFQFLRRTRPLLIASVVIAFIIGRLRRR